MHRRNPHRFCLINTGERGAFLLRTSDGGEGCSGAAKNPAAPPSQFEFLFIRLFGRSYRAVGHFPPLSRSTHLQSSVISDIMCRDGLGDVFSRVGADVGAKLVWAGLDGSFFDVCLDFLWAHDGPHFFACHRLGCGLDGCFF